MISLYTSLEVLKRPVAKPEPPGGRSELFYPVRSPRALAYLEAARDHSNPQGPSDLPTAPLRELKHAKHRLKSEIESARGGARGEHTRGLVHKLRIVQRV